MTKRVLYVDDEADIREIAEIALGLDQDFDVRTCGSGEQAIAIVGEWHPDVILLDVMMPGLDGPSTFARLKADYGDALSPVLFCTARTQAEDLKSYRDIGGAGVIAKPFDPMTLAAHVRDAIVK